MKKECYFRGAKVAKTLIFYTHTHTHTHTHTSNHCREIFARMRKPTTVDVNGGLTIFMST